MYQKKYNPPKNIISHTDNKSWQEAFNEIKQKILKATHKTENSAMEQMQILEELKCFALGQFLIQNRGLNGAWTQYIVLHPQYGRLTSRGIDGKPLSKLEKWILDKCPIVLATQERFYIFQKLLQEKLKDNIKLASVPCGLMDDLLGLNYSNIKNFKLTGVDLDPESLELARDNANYNQLAEHCKFIEEDAWNMKITNQFDIITSNGLNIYEPNDAKVSKLYKNIYNGLKDKGTLITSFLSTPPDVSKESNWNMKEISAEDFKLQRVVLDDILNIRWQTTYRDENTMTKILQQCGFKDIKVIYDRQHLIPTVTATKN